jgi:hypothetical protein
MNTHLDENGYDHLARLQHCCECEQPLVQYLTGKALVNYTSCTWQHYIGINHGAVFSKKIPARALMTHIPAQSNLSYCYICLPAWRSEGCGTCGNPVDPQEHHSVLESYQHTPDGRRTNLRKISFHSACLPHNFNMIHEKRLARGATLS